MIPIFVPSCYALSHVVLAYRLSMWGNGLMRLKMFYEDELRDKDVRPLQARVNRWLRKLGIRSEYRVVRQETRMAGYEGSMNPAVVVSIWYDKVPKEGTA